MKKTRVVILTVLFSMVSLFHIYRAQNSQTLNCLIDYEDEIIKELEENTKCKLLFLDSIYYPCKKVTFDKINLFFFDTLDITEDFILKGFILETESRYLYVDADNFFTLKSKFNIYEFDKEWNLKEILFCDNEQLIGYFLMTKYLKRKDTYKIGVAIIPEEDRIDILQLNIDDIKELNHSKNFYKHYFLSYGTKCFDVMKILKGQGI